MTETQLRELLQRASHDIDVGTPPTFDDLTPTAPSLRRRWHTAWPVLAGAASIAIVVVVLLTLLPNNSANNNDVADSNPAPYDANAEMRPDLMKAEPSTAYPAEHVFLRFPEKTLRSSSFVLEARVGNTWDYRYYLTSFGIGVPEWYVGTPAVSLGDGTGGRGRERVVIPPPSSPGEYRICTTTVGDSFCTPIQVRESLPLHAQPTTAFNCGSHPLGDNNDSTLPATSDIDFALVCPFGGGSPLVVDSDNLAFADFVGALALPDVEYDPAMGLCAKSDPQQSSIILASGSNSYRVQAPLAACGSPRTEVAEAIEAMTPDPAKADYLDPLTMTLEFGQPSGGAITVSSGGNLPSDWTIANNSRGAVTDPLCHIPMADAGMVPIGDPDAPLTDGRPGVVDCDSFTMKPGYHAERPGPTFTAATQEGEAYPPGQYLAVVEIEGLSQRITYPVTVTE